MKSRDPQAEALTEVLFGIGASGRAAWTAFVEKTQKRPDAVDRLAEALRQDLPEARVLLGRIIAAVREEPKFSDLAVDLMTWRAVPFVDVFFRGPSTGGKRPEGPLPRFKKAVDFHRVEAIRDALLELQHRFPSTRSARQALSFLQADQSAGRFHASPRYLPFIATALHRMNSRRDDALDLRSDGRTAGIAPQRLAAWVVLAATGRAHGYADVRRFLDRLEKRVPPN
ncbi:MAG: hypothetical protein KBB14_13695 [Thermoanaerobaculia bacterium]|nr:hypothetical protein [Thermoanaerobaculia bacterium]